MKKIFTNYRTIITIAIIAFLSFQNSLLGQIGITFTFDNGQITSSGPDQFYEFDIMASATGNSQFSLAQIYIDYSATGFGSNISGTTNLLVTPGPLLALVNNIASGGDIGNYAISSANNAPNKLAIQNTWTKTPITNTQTAFDLTNTLGTTPQVYAHVKMKIMDINQTSAISFDPSVTSFDEQQYYYSSGDTQVKYSPVNTGATLDQPLPVELSSFSINAVEGTKAQLQWETATEVNNYGFEIQRSIISSEKAEVKSENAEASELEREWEMVAFVEGHGNSNSIKNYSFTDKNLVGGSKFMYRLKQIDIDGTFEYSDAVEIEVLPTKYELLQNYPNPFNPETNIKFSLPENAKIAINIYNILGEKVTTLLNEELNAGFHQVNFNTNSAGYSLASGMYIYTIETKNFSQVKKMILMK